MAGGNPYVETYEPGPWRAGKDLVVRMTNPLAERCVVCDAPASGLKLRLVEHNKGWIRGTGRAYRAQWPEHETR